MNAVRAEWYRLWRRRSPWGLLMASVACVFGYYVLTWASAAAASLAVSRGAPQPAGPGPGALVDALGLARFGTTGLDVAASLATLALIAVASSLVGSEYASGTLRLIVPRLGDRAAFVAAKFAVLAAFASLTVAACVEAALLASVLVTFVADLPRPAAPALATAVVVGALRTLVAVAPYAAIALAATFLSRSTAVGFAIGLAVFLLEGVATAIAGALLGVPLVADLGIARNVHVVMRATPGDDVRIPGFDAPLALAILAAYACGALFLAISVFRRRDLVA